MASRDVLTIALGVLVAVAALGALARAANTVDPDRITAHDLGRRQTIDGVTGILI